MPEFSSEELTAIRLSLRVALWATLGSLPVGVLLAFVLAFRPNVPDSDIFKVLIGGFMTVGFASIINFYFGSSSGSKSKDDTLNQIAAAATQTNGSAEHAAPVPVVAAAPAQPNS